MVFNIRFNKKGELDSILDDYNKYEQYKDLYKEKINELLIKFIEYSEERSREIIKKVKEKFNEDKHIQILYSNDESNKLNIIYKDDRVIIVINNPIKYLDNIKNYKNGKIENITYEPLEWTISRRFIEYIVNEKFPYTRNIKIYKRDLIDDLLFLNNLLSEAITAIFYYNTYKNGKMEEYNIKISQLPKIYLNNLNSLILNHSKNIIEAYNSSKNIRNLPVDKILELKRQKDEYVNILNKMIYYKSLIFGNIFGKLLYEEYGKNSIEEIKKINSVDEFNRYTNDLFNDVNNEDKEEDLEYINETKKFKVADYYEVITNIWRLF
ncbi:hypothetical protein YN1_8040 [Nanoarchaeota archaeon]